MWAHAGALLLVLVALLPLIGTTGQFSADEGAALAQADRLERGDGWTMPNSFPEADPTGDAFPFELSARSGDVYAPFAKHPVYPVVLAGLLRVGGRAGVLLLSIAGTVLTALLAAALARRIDETVRVPAFWLVGLASPLFFDSYVVIAHTLGAACAGAAAWTVARPRRDRIGPAGLAGLFAATAAGVLLRTEMVFFAIALSIALLYAGRRAIRRVAVVAAVPLLAVAAALVLEGMLVRAIMGGPVEVTEAVTSPGGSLIGDRVFSFVITWLLPSYSLDPDAALLLVAAAAAAVAAHLARTKPDERDGIRLFAVVAAAAAVGRLAFGSGAVPGLLVAFPLFTAGVVVALGAARRTRAARIAGLTFTVFAVAVVATQYAPGGSGEWGGRYFALGLPLAVPVLLSGLRTVVARLDRTTARVAVASACALSLALSALAVITLRQQHIHTDALADLVDATAASHPAHDGGAPVVLSSDGAAARLSYEVVDRTRWLTVNDDDLATFAERLHDLRVGDITFVTREEDDLDSVLGSHRALSATHPGDDWIVYVLTPR